MTENARRDIVYGRRGGRWAPPAADDALTAIAAARHAAGPDWPTLTDDAHLWRPTTVASWQGLARHSHVRQTLNLPLTDLDLEALTLYPNPPGLLDGLNPQDLQEPAP